MVRFLAVFCSRIQGRPTAERSANVGRFAPSRRSFAGQVNFSTLALHAHDGLERRNQLDNLDPRLSLRACTGLKATRKVCPTST